jgi:hypothetical protein
MGNEATRYALILERIGRKVLKALQDLPENALDWVPPLPVCYLLLDEVTELIETTEFWINLVVGRQKTEYAGRDDLLLILYTHGELSYLIARYKRWLHSLHEILDDISDAWIETAIVLPPSHRATLSEGPMTPGNALLHLIERSACQQGKIQLLCQIYTEMIDLAEPHHAFQTDGEQQQSDDTLFLSPQEAKT